MTIDDIKKIELQILIDVSKYCNDNNLSYVLFYGTLLGAVRHGGFIPWDDDIDIIMPRSDYEYFIKNFKSENLNCVDCFSTEEYFYPFAKVYNSKYPIQEKSKFDSNIGIYIDIFPVDYINPRKCKTYQKKQLFLHKIWSGAIDVKNTTSNSVLRRMFADFFSLKRTQKLSRRMETLVKKNSLNNSDIITIYVETKKNGLLRLDSDLFDSVDFIFEGYEFKIPKRYDFYLKKIYGDYMKLPPAEERVNTHSFTVKGA